MIIYKLCFPILRVDSIVLRQFDGSVRRVSHMKIVYAGELWHRWKRDKASLWGLAPCALCVTAANYAPGPLKKGGIGSLVLVEAHPARVASAWLVGCRTIQTQTNCE